jgi:hypothetical protein
LLPYLVSNTIESITNEQYSILVLSGVLSTHYATGTNLRTYSNACFLSVKEKDSLLYNTVQGAGLPIYLQSAGGSGDVFRRSDPRLGSRPKKGRDGGEGDGWR